MPCRKRADGMIADIHQKQNGAALRAKDKLTDK